MKNIYKFILTFVLILLSVVDVSASVFADKFVKCAPYIQDEGDRLIQIAGYMNRLCVYRELTLDTTNQCAFNEKQMSLIRQELKLRNYIDTSLDNLQTYAKFSTMENTCELGNGNTTKKTGHSRNRSELD